MASSTVSSKVFLSNALEGQTAVITGAARGIGRATALALAGAGANVAGLDLCGVVDPRSGVLPATAAELHETGRMVEALGRRWQSHVVDQRDLPAVRAAAAEIERSFGAVDVLFANAGIQQFNPFLEMEDADWHITIDTNLTGTANVIRAFGPAMKARSAGRIVITTSTQGQKGTLHGAAYSATKWALIGLMKSLALELGKNGITVNCLVPGLIDTPLTRHEERYAQALEVSGKTPSGELAEDEAKAKEGLARLNPLGISWIDPDHIAPVVVFLASEAGAMVSGSTYEVTAGDSAKTSS